MTVNTVNGEATTSAQSVRAVVTSTFTAVAAEQNKDITTLSDDLALMDSGLDSLCIAIIVARLDDHFGVDPFGGDDFALPVTIADFIRIYEHATA
jgi:hypothetical protein